MTSLEGGNGGRSLCGVDGSNGMSAKSPHLSTRSRHMSSRSTRQRHLSKTRHCFDMSERLVDAIDNSPTYVENTTNFRHVDATRRGHRQLGTTCRKLDKFSTCQGRSSRLDRHVRTLCQKSPRHSTIICREST